MTRAERKRSDQIVRELAEMSRNDAGRYLDELIRRARALLGKPSVTPDDCLEWENLTEEEQDGFLAEVPREYGETVEPKEALRKAKRLYEARVLCEGGD